MGYTNTGLNTARKNKKDEFYTTYADIHAEMILHPDQFRGKAVYCNCDDWEKSNFCKYFQEHFEELGLKALYATCYNGKEEVYSSSLWEWDDEPEENREAKYFIMTAPDDIEIGTLKGNGDFASEECLEFLKKSDIVATNPPFSLLRKFLVMCLENNKEFLVLGNLNALKTKDFVQYIVAHRMWWGGSIHSGDREFEVPDDYPLEACMTRVDETGRKFIRVKGVRWYTNMPYEGMYKPLPLTENYSAEKYPKFDDYDAINVGSTAEIPKDYYEKMGVPITFFDKYDPEQFILYGIDAWLPDNPHPGRGFTINGEPTYARFIIQRKK